MPRPYTRKLILHAPSWDAPALNGFVEDALRDGVALVCVVGSDCARVEDVIDELVVGRGDDACRFLNTTSHPGETLDVVRAFAASCHFGIELSEPVQEIWLASP